MSRREARKSLLIKATTSASSSSSSPAAHAATSNQRGQLESLTRGKQQLHSIVGGSLFFFGKEANNANAANGISDALADAVLGEFDLARADFVFRLAAGDSAFVAEVRFFLTLLAFFFCSLLFAVGSIFLISSFISRSSLTKNLVKRLPNAATTSLRSARLFSASTTFAMSTSLHRLSIVPLGALPFPIPSKLFDRKRCSRYGFSGCCSAD
jgi:hypothetical protein